jgi:spore maturation protein CgeB
MRILIIGAQGSTHVGGSLFRAATKLGHEPRLCDINQAWQYGRLWQRVLWHWGGRRPARLGAFCRQILATCDTFQPDVLIATGMAPVTATILQGCRAKKIPAANFSTDDPFSRISRRAGWFLQALREYDVVFSPRRANLTELEQHGCRAVKYLPFAYDSDLFFPEPAAAGMASDLLFAGQADRERVPFLSAALKAGFQVRLYGDGWNAHPATRGISLGQADTPTLRRAISACRVALGGVRHVNRDGNSMRTFEIPAVGACLLAEDTAEHREIYGAEGECVWYYQTPEEMVTKTKTLLADPRLREQLKSQVYQRITQGHHTYGDRLQAMLAELERGKPKPG